MIENIRTEAQKIALEKRILNEFATKTLNEEDIHSIIEESQKSRQLQPNSKIVLRCECDSKTCLGTISISTQDYIKTHQKTKQFIVLNTHVRLDIEHITQQFTKYALVEKYFPHPSHA